MTWAKPDLSLAFKKKLEMGFSKRVGEGGISMSLLKQHATQLSHLCGVS
jgi:hypothetical protein